MSVLNADGEITMDRLPPKNSMFSFTHFSASNWSFKPIFPEYSEVSNDKNPNGPSLWKRLSEIRDLKQYEVA